MKKVINTIFGFFLALYDLILARTTFLSVQGLATLKEAQASGRPIILAAWHGQDHLLYGFVSRYFRIREFVLIVDGDQYEQVLSTYVKVLGIKPIPINMRDTTMGAAKGILNIVRALKAGRTTLIAPDGPTGPAREPKAGIAAIARRAGAIILPIAMHTNFAIQLDRWDRKYHPFPLARVTAGIGDPIDPEAIPDNEVLLAHISNALNDISGEIQKPAADPGWFRISG